MADSPEVWTRIAEAGAVFLAGLFGVRHGRKSSGPTCLHLERRVNNLEARADGHDAEIKVMGVDIARMQGHWEHVRDTLDRIEGRLDGRIAERRTRSREDQ